MTEQLVLSSNSSEARAISPRTGLVPGTCLNCRRQKQRCDRIIPQCSRCSMKSVRCIYPTKSDASMRGLVPASSSTSDMLMACSSPCSFHLSPLGERNLLWAACSKSCSYIEGDYSQPSLSRFVRDIFHHSGISVTDVVTKYFGLAYHWLPTLDRDVVYGEAAYFASEEAISHDSFALLLLCMHLFAEGPCQHQPQLAQSALYRIVRQLFAILQSSPGTLALTLLQCGIIMTTYACGHGLSVEAYETLTTCIGLIRRLSVDGYTASERNNDPNGEHFGPLELDLCWSGIILLDRTIALSEIDRCLPHLVEVNHLPPSSAIFQVSKADLYGRDVIRNLLARAEHAIRMDDLLKAIRGPDAGKYEAVEIEIYNQISDYICTPQGGSFPLCETVAMSLSALIMLYRTNDYYKTSINNPKTILAFNCAHNMIIETCRAEAEWIQRHGWLNNSRPCFLGLCCLYGAAAHLDELCSDGLSTEDMWALRNSLLRFSTRWKLGDDFLRHLDSTKRII